MSLLRHRALSLKLSGLYEGFDTVIKGVNAGIDNGGFDVHGAAPNPSTYRWAVSKAQKSSGKWRVQFLVVVHANTGGVGVATGTALGIWAGSNAQAACLYGNYGASLRLYHNASAVAHSSGLTYSNGTLIDVYVDIDNGRAWWARNGTVISGDPAAGTGAMFTFTPGTPVRVCADPTGETGRLRIRTDPAQFSGAGIAGFVDGWPT